VTLADDAFWMALYPFEFSDATLARGAAQVDEVLALSGICGGRALDLACGPGRHAVALAQRGFGVTAVDLSPALLAIARERATTAGVSIDFVAADMRAFVRPDTFDLAVCLFTSFGYFDAHDDLAVLTNVLSSLRRGGVFVLDLMSKESIAGTLQLTVEDRAADGTLRLRRHEVIEDWTRLRNEWTVTKDGRTETFEFVLRMYSGQELRHALAAAGFSGVRLFGGLDGQPYGSDAARLVAVATK
jgi:SAM-dependent methyltransferase